MRGGGADWSVQAAPGARTQNEFSENFEREGKRKHYLLGYGYANHGERAIPAQQADGFFWGRIRERKSI